MKNSFTAEQIARHSLPALTLHKKKSKQILSVIHTECNKKQLLLNTRQGTLLTA